MYRSWILVIHVYVRIVHECRLIILCRIDMTLTSWTKSYIPSRDLHIYIFHSHIFDLGVNDSDK